MSSGKYIFQNSFAETSPLFNTPSYWLYLIPQKVGRTLLNTNHFRSVIRSIYTTVQMHLNGYQHEDVARYLINLRADQVLHPHWNQLDTNINSEVSKLKTPDSRVAKGDYYSRSVFIKPTSIDLKRVLSQRFKDDIRFQSFDDYAPIEIAWNRGFKNQGYQWFTNTIKDKPSYSYQGLPANYDMWNDLDILTNVTSVPEDLAQAIYQNFNYEFISWLSNLNQNADLINGADDFEIFGEHQLPEFMTPEFLDLLYSKNKILRRELYRITEKQLDSNFLKHNKRYVEDNPSTNSLLSKLDNSELPYIKFVPEDTDLEVVVQDYPITDPIIFIQPEILVDPQDPHTNLLILKTWFSCQKFDDDTNFFKLEIMIPNDIVANFEISYLGESLNS